MLDELEQETQPRKPKPPCGGCEKHAFGCREGCDKWTEYEAKKKVWYDYKEKVWRKFADADGFKAQGVLRARRREHQCRRK